MTDESSIGIWLWIFLILAINAMWISMDIWLHNHGHEYLTDEFREGISNPVWGPILLLLVVNTVAVFVGHMWFKWW